jgi:tetratricopeptide (TPR) repeat protein
MGKKKHRRNRSILVTQNTEESVKRENSLFGVSLQQKQLLRAIPLLAGATLLLFSRTLTNQFLQWDDTLHLIPTGSVEHYSIGEILRLFLKPHDIPVTFAFWRMLTNVFLPAGAAFKEIAALAAPFHALNVIVHAMNVLLVYALAKRLLHSAKAATIAGMFFSFHPLQTEAVAWVSGLKDLLSTMFVLGSILLHLKSYDNERQKKTHILILKSAAACAFLLACMSKQTAGIAPVLLGVIYVLYYRRRLRDVLVDMLPWMAIAILLGFWTKATQPDFSIKSTVAIPLRLLVFSDALAFYLRKTLLPVNLAPDYARTPLRILESGAIWFTWLFPAAVLLLCLRCKAKAQTLKAMAVFVIALLPVSGLIPFGFQNHSTVADRYTYIAMLGPALLFGQVFSWHYGKFRNAAFILPLIIYGGLTFQQIGRWQNTSSLFSYNLHVNPRSALSHVKLGTIALDTGKVAKAKTHYLKSIHLKPDDDAGYQSLGHLYLEEGVLDSAVHYYREALKREWLSSETHSNLATSHGRLGNHQEAIRHFREALALSPELCEAHLGLGYEYHLRGLCDSALTHYRKAEACTGGSTDLHRNMAQCLDAVGDSISAERYRQRVAGTATGAHELGSTEVHHDTQPLSQHAITLNDSGARLAQAGKPFEAKALFERAISLSPHYENANNNLRRALLELGMQNAALAFFDSLVQAMPDNFAAHLNLGIVYRVIGNSSAALRQLTAAASLRGGHAELLNEKGILYAQDGQLGTARAYFQAALEVNPSYSSARKNLARANKLIAGISR